jgi:hypothetical protein
MLGNLSPFSKPTGMEMGIDVVRAVGNTAEKRGSVSMSVNAGHSIGVGKNIVGGTRAGTRLLRLMATSTGIEVRQSCESNSSQ